MKLSEAWLREWANPPVSTAELCDRLAQRIRDAALRESFLREACRANSPLRASVDDMLADHDQATRLFQKVAADVTVDSETADDALQDRDLETTIGPYRLLKRLGYRLQVSLNPALVRAAIGLDKKRERGRQRWILPMAIGQTVEVDDLTEAELTLAVRAIGLD